MDKRLYVWFVWIVALFGCSPSPHELLDRAEDMWKVSADSVDYYLKQIEIPERLGETGQARYYLLKSKLDLNRTGKYPDSLMQVAETLFRQSRDSVYMQDLLFTKIRACFYRRQYDSAAGLCNVLLKDYVLSDTVRYMVYGCYRNIYVRQERYPEALSVTEKQCDAAYDTLSLGYAKLGRIEVLQAMRRQKETDEAYDSLLRYFQGCDEYEWFRNEIFRSRLSELEKQERWGEAVAYSDSLREGKEIAVPRKNYLLAKSYEAIGRLDSARYFYEQAAQGLSEDVAQLAFGELSDLGGLIKDVYRLRQKENMVASNRRLELDSQLSVNRFKQVQLENELYSLKMKRQQQLIGLMGALSGLLVIIGVVLFFYFREKRKRMIADECLYKERMEEETRTLRYENELLQKEAKLSLLREALFRRLSFFTKFPSLGKREKEERPNKIRLSEEEWREVEQAVNEAFGEFVMRLKQKAPALTEKDIRFCCLVKLNVNMQDLSDIYCVSKAAISKRKFRLKTEKLGITDEQLSLDDVLRGI